MKLKMTPKRILITALATGFLSGVMWMTAVRFLTVKSDDVHYHANFALYVNGERDSFESPTFYEEVQACGGEDVSNPKIRGHMHNQENDIVHVHANGVTWGHFLANLGYGLSNTVLMTDDGVFIDKQNDKQLTFILNGKPASLTANQHIDNEDVLLINYGDESEAELMERYAAIPTDAEKYNNTYDPGGCTSGKPFTFWERLKQAIGIE